MRIKFGKTNSILVEQSRKIKGGKIVLRRFRAADQLGGPILLQKDLRRAELAVVIVSHRETMRPGIVENKQIPHVNLRQHTVDGKLIVVLAQSPVTSYWWSQGWSSLPITVMW